MLNELYLGDLTRPLSGMGFGRVPADVMVIGDNPPKKAMVNGIWQYTQAVRGLWTDLRDNVPGELTFYFTFLVKEALAQGKVKSPIKEARANLPFLYAEIRMVKPKRVLVYGYHATRLLCPGFNSLRDDHGAIFYNEDLGVEVVPTFDPLVGFYDLERKEYFFRDLIRLFTVNRPKAEDFPQTMIVHPGEPVIWGLGDTVVLDVETTGLDPRKDSITLLGVSNPDGWVTILVDPDRNQLQSLHRAILEKGTTVSGHNIKFDLLFCSYGSRESWTDFPVIDTMLMARVAGERILGLKHLTSMLTNRPGPHAYGGTESWEYLREDLLSTWEVLQALVKRVPLDNPAVDLLNHASRAFVEMYLSGVRVDLNHLGQVSQELETRSANALKKLTVMGTINWNSSEQVAGWLQDNGVKLTEKTAGGAYSTSAEVLEALVEDYPVVGDLLSYREAEKLAAYIKDYRSNLTTSHPFVHSEYNLTGTRTGRISCENPNLQNVPPELRRLFVSRWVEDGGMVGVVDLDQAEMRTAGILSGDRAFCEMLKTEDVHKAIASVVYDIPVDQVDDLSRKHAKTCTFGLVYGGTVFGIAQKLGTTEDVVQAVMDKIYNKFPQFTGFLEALGRYAMAHKRITSPLGRTRDLVVEFQNKGMGAVRRMGINTPIQTTSSDVTMFLIVSIRYGLKRKGLQSVVVGTVHDSIALDVHPREKPQVAECVQDAFLALQRWTLGGKFPLFWEVPFTGTFGLGRTWYDAEKDPVETWPCSSLSKKLEVNNA